MKISENMFADSGNNVHTEVCNKLAVRQFKYKYKEKCKQKCIEQMSCPAHKHQFKGGHPAN